MRDDGARDGTAESIALAAKLSSGGHMTEALEELDAAVKRAGARPELYAFRSELHFQVRSYLASLRDIGKAIKLSPRDPSLYVQRSDLLAQINRGSEARRDLDRAVELSPRDERLRLARLRLLVHDADGRLADREIAGLLDGASPAAVLETLCTRGYLRVKRGDCAAAEADFAKVLSEVGPQDSLALRARFYRLVARVKKSGAAARRPGPRLLVTGLGLFPPYTPSLETLRALMGCDVLVNNVSGSETRELLSALCPVVKPATYDNMGDEDLWTKRIFSELEDGKSVAFVTRGHALVFGGLGAMLLEKARAARVSAETLPCLSTLDVLPALMARLFGENIDGFQAREDRTLHQGAKPDVSRPQIVYFYGALDAPEVGKLETVLRKHYPARQPCWIFGPKYDTNPEALCLEDLARRYPAIHPSLVLYVPARVR